MFLENQIHQFRLLKGRGSISLPYFSQATKFLFLITTRLFTSETGKLRLGIAFGQGSHTLELRNIVINDTSFLTSLWEYMCIQRSPCLEFIIFIFIFIISRMAKWNSQFSRRFTQTYLPTFCRTVFPSFVENDPGRIKDMNK